MSKLMIVTHGNLSSALLATAEMIVGRQEDVVTFGVDLGCSLEKLTEDIRKAMAMLTASGEQVIVLTDIFFGTPFNIIMSMSEEYEFQHITGVNLSILLEILIRRNELQGSDIHEILEQGRSGIIDCSEIIGKNEANEKGGEQHEECIDYKN